MQLCRYIELEGLYNKMGGKYFMQKKKEFIGKNNVTSNTGSTNIDLSVAVGYAYGEGKEINQIIKKADQRMYQKKREQKSRNQSNI